jgi:hypothetical protein
MSVNNDQYDVAAVRAVSGMSALETLTRIKRRAVDADCIILGTVIDDEFRVFRAGYQSLPG